MEKLYDYLITSNQLQTQTSLQSQSLTQSILMNHNRLINSGGGGGDNQSSASSWSLKMYSDVLHLHKPGRDTPGTGSGRANVDRVAGAGGGDSGRLNVRTEMTSASATQMKSTSNDGDVIPSKLSPDGSNPLSTSDVYSPLSTPFRSLQPQSQSESLSLSQQPLQPQEPVSADSTATNPPHRDSMSPLPAGPMLYRTNSDGGVNAVPNNEEDTFTRISTSGAQEVFIFDFGR